RAGAGIRPPRHPLRHHRRPVGAAQSCAADRVQSDAAAGTGLCGGVARAQHRGTGRAVVFHRRPAKSLLVPVPRSRPDLGDAAAAPDLGTPLSTICLMSRELEKTVQDAQLAGDLKTLREQAQRCRDILAKITQLSSSGAPFDRMKLSTLIEETVAPHRDFGVAIKVRVAVSGIKEPVGSRNPAILYGVGNILENAVDFADRKSVV